MDVFNLEGKKILVFGASSGIGRSIAQRLAHQSASVIISARNEKRLTETFVSLYGQNHISITADLTNNEDVIRLVEQLSPLDGVVFCAGIVDTGMPAKMINETQLESILNTNFKCQILLYQQIHKQKKINKGASLLFISSVTGLAAIPTTLAYAASKAAITCSVRVLATELSKYDIRVNSISPGLIRTPLLEDIEEENLKIFENKYPLGLGDPDDVANASVFLLSDASKWITGIDLIVDGGFMLRT